MSNKSEHRYHIENLEIGQPLTGLSVPPDCSGFAAVVRLHGCPVGFFMEELPPGAHLDPEALATRIVKKAGKQILAERIYRELKSRGPKNDGQPPLPSLDIAICTHGRPDALACCLTSLASLRAIDIVDLGVVVIDNAPSDDRTKDAVLQFAHRKLLPLRYVVEPKPGLDFARNRAIQESERELLAFLDDDVVVDPGWLEGMFEAHRDNPDACAFMGPILPFELETRAQIVFEQMGGFGKSFDRVRFAKVLFGVPTYPVGAGIFGAGANMIFRRDLLVQLGGFDDALDTGAPLPGGGDLDMFYRIARSGFPLVREPRLLVFHQHRQEYRALRHQMWTWGLGTMAFVTKTWREDREQRPKIRRWLLWWLSYQLSKIFLPSLRRNRARWPWDMVAAELLGAVVGILGEYDRSVARIERLRRQFA